MALRVFGSADADLEALRVVQVAIIGYGNQGRAHALNLRDSGISVLVGQRPGRSFDQAVQDGFSPLSIREAAESAGLVVVSLPDVSAPDVFTAEIAPTLTAGKTLGFVHGFNIRYGFILPPPITDVVMVAPKGPGSLLRALYVDGKGLPSLLAVHRDASGTALRTALGWAAGIGSTRAGVVASTFADETETDLFGEQTVLCGGVTALMKAAFETLVEAGYAPEFAYLECVHELKQVVDLIYERGIGGMRERISTTAQYGDVTRGPRLVTEETRLEMQRMLAEIRTGEFAREWVAEFRAGSPRFRALLDADRDTDFERAGERVRALMPWLTNRGA